MSQVRWAPKTDPECVIPLAGRRRIVAAIERALNDAPLFGIPLKKSNSGSSHAMWRVEIEDTGLHPRLYVCVNV